MTRQNLIYAGHLERFFAYLIDTIILVFVAKILAAILGVNGVALLLSFATSITYYTYFTASGWQATQGKRLLGLYVIRTDGAPLTLRDSGERFLAYILPSLPIYSSFLSPALGSMLTFWLLIFWFVPILFTNERIGYHDRLCRTRVVAGKRNG